MIIMIIIELVFVFPNESAAHLAVDGVDGVDFHEAAR